MQKFSLEKTVGKDDPKTACDLLVQHTGLSKSRIKDAMNKGTVWIRKEKGKCSRLWAIPGTERKIKISPA